MGKRILTVGEPMGLLIAQEEGGLDEVKHFTSAIAGAEFNVAVHPVAHKPHRVFPSK